MLRSLDRRVSILLVMLSAIAACAPQPPTPTLIPDATPSLVPTDSPGPTITVWPTLAPRPTPTPVPTSTPAPTPVAVYPPLAALARGQVTLDGSTSTQPLRALIACQAIGAACYWDSFYDERSIEVPARYTDFVWRAIGNSGTHGAYVTLMEGKSDVILVARAPSEAEVKAARELGVTFDARPVALDALVFLANIQNPVNNLRLDDARSIYAGQINDWKEVGGDPGEIQAYQREDESGSQEMLKSLVMKDLPPINAPEMVVEGMGGPYTAIDYESSGIAYSVYYYATAMRPDGRIKLLSIDGIPPTGATIAARSYPLAAEVYVVVREGLPKDSPTLRIRDWLLSEAGQAVVTASGYISVPPVAQTNPASAGRVQWDYKVLDDLPPEYPLDIFETALDAQGKDGWEYLSDLYPVSASSIFKRASADTDSWHYHVLLFEEVSKQANVLGRDGWDGLGGFSTFGQVLFKRSDFHSIPRDFKSIRHQDRTEPALEKTLNQEGEQGWEAYFGYYLNLSFKRSLAHPDQWRYEIVTLDIGTLDAWNGAVFREEGLAGWEYVATGGGLGLEDPAPGEPYLFKRPATNATPWEYKGVAVGGLLSGPPEGLERFLNEQGQDGWELIDMTRFELFFRRHP